MIKIDKKIVEEVSQAIRAFRERGALESVWDRLGAIDRKGRLEDLKKVLVVGEIYVRRDNFSVQELSEMLVDKGIYPKVTGVTEWFHYTDFARKFIMEGHRRREG